MIFEKQHLQFEHYTWSDKSEPQFTGNPSRRLFDRFNGDQVLFIINFLALQDDKFALQDLRMTEQSIFRKLPADARSEMAVVNWLQGLTYTSVKDPHLAG